MTGSDFICIGHRGARGRAPENTLAGVRKGLTLGADWIEVDVHCVQGVPVVIHDSTLNRTTNGKGNLEDQTLESLRMLDAGDGERIPLLSEVFEEVRARGGLNIELKGKGTAGPVLDLVRRQVEEFGWSKDLILISSFDPQELMAARELEPDIQLGLLMDRVRKDWPELTHRLQAGTLHVDHRRIRSSLVRRAHDLGLRVFGYTVNLPGELLRLKRMGLDGVFSDFPDMCVRQGQS
jgi:glycerophosphoryl diester phosphodiesterase